MSKHTICVLRELSGRREFIPVSEVPFLVPGERAYIGEFNAQLEKHGPYGSHERTVCTPAGELASCAIPSTALVGGKLRADAQIMQCVLREVVPGDTQYRPVSDVQVLHDGEQIFTGVFRTQRENHGPYGSHSMLIALPFGEIPTIELRAA